MTFGSWYQPSGRVITDNPTKSDGDVSDDDGHDVGDDHDDIGARTCARLSTDPPTHSLEPLLFCIGSGINDFCQCFSQKLDKPSTI